VIRRLPWSNTGLQGNQGRPCFQHFSQPRVQRHPGRRPRLGPLNPRDVRPPTPHGVLYADSPVAGAVTLGLLTGEAPDGARRRVARSRGNAQRKRRFRPCDPPPSLLACAEASCFSITRRRSAPRPRDHFVERVVPSALRRLDTRGARPAASGRPGTSTAQIDHRDR
jgi:hypothetical protein